ADDGARASRQGSQGPLRSLAEQHAEDPPPVLGDAPPSPLAVPCHWPRWEANGGPAPGAFQRARRDAPGGPTAEDPEGDFHPLASAQLRHPLARGRRQPAADPAVPRTQLAEHDDGLPPSDHGESGASDRPDRDLDGALTDADRRRRAAAVRRR